MLVQHLENCGLAIAKPSNGDQPPEVFQDRAGNVVAVLKQARRGRPKARKVAGRRNFKDGSRSAALRQADLLVRIAAFLPQPITARELTKAAGLKDVKVAAGAVWRWENRSKWLKRVGVGRYERTRLFPKCTPVEPQPMAGDRLKAAKADLADAIAKHEPTRARVAADLVRELEGSV